MFVFLDYCVEWCCSDLHYPKLNFLCLMFQICQQLLSDPSQGVRAIVAYGVCRISAVYWEFIPAETIRQLLSIVAQKLAWDSSSTDVRHAVIKVTVIGLWLS